MIRETDEWPLLEDEDVRFFYSHGHVPLHSSPGDRRGYRRPEMVFCVEELDRFEDLRSIFGWRYDVTAWAWDDEQQRYRPAPFLIENSLFGWRRRARSEAEAQTVGRELLEDLKERDYTARSRRSWSR